MIEDNQIADIENDVEDTENVGTETEENTTGANSEETEENSENTENGEDTSEEIEDTPSDENSEEAEDSEYLTVESGDDLKKINKIEAVEYVNKGMQFEKLTPTIQKLERLMKISTDTEGNPFNSLEDFVDNTLNTMEQQEYDRIFEEVGDEEIAKELFEARKIKREAEYAAAIEEQKQAQKTESQKQAERVAAEFETLRQEFPEIKEYKDVPEAVRQFAYTHKCTLLEAKFRVERSVAKAKENSEHAAEKSTGKVDSTTGVSDPLISAMRKGLSR